MFTPSRKSTQYYYFLFVKIVWSFFFSCVITVQVIVFCGISVKEHVEDVTFTSVSFLIAILDRQLLF